MASSAAMSVSFGLTHFPFRPRAAQLARASVRLAPLGKAASLKLSSAHAISGFASAQLPRKPLATAPSSGDPRSLSIVAHKGYKMKTHKASAKRFRVTGRGKIVRRGAGKQHLLYKKNKKRKLRLSKMQIVHRSDYDNVISCLPYMKVNRKAT